VPHGIDGGCRRAYHCSVDATYRSDLRELNEINFLRFDAKLEQRAVSIEAKIDGLEARLDRRIDVLEERLETRFAVFEERIEKRFAIFEARILRWTLTLWTGTMLAFAGLVVAVLRSK
jgi:hypothetical protein